MELLVKNLNCLFRWFSSPSGRSPRRDVPEAGYILLIVMMMATLLLISLAAAAPSIYVEGQREKEKELIFRGEQYARAIMMFHEQFKRYPSSIKELLHTNNLSFLRKAYPDPMTRSGEWRFIHATANGVILDSKILKPPGQQKNKPLGDNSNSEGSQSTSTSSTTDQPAAQSGSQNNGFKMGGFALPGLEQNSGQEQQQHSSSSFFGDNGIKGALIVGVASTSHHQSIGVFDKRTEYDEWEFLGIPGAPGAPNILGPGAVGGVGVQPGQSPNGLPGSQSNSGGGFHLSPSQPSQPSQSGSVFGNSNP
jgi:hypothetical protein